MIQGAVVRGDPRRTVTHGGHSPLRHRCWGQGLRLAVLLGLSWAGVGLAAPGDLDPTFGAGGVAITFGPQDTANALIQQADGKLVVAGTSTGDGFSNMLLARFLPDGRLDASFGPGGKVTARFGSGSSANALVQQPDGRLVVAGASSGHLALVRFLPDGRADATFGQGGLVTTPFWRGSRATGLVLQPDGQLVAAGDAINDRTYGAYVLARYHPDGRLDASFGQGGTVLTVLRPEGFWAGPLRLQPDGKLVLAGKFLVRYLPDGRMDLTFGDRGSVATYCGGNVGMALQPDGKLVLGGCGGGTAFLRRYSPHGTLDPTFGSGGGVPSPFGGQAFVRGTILQPNGKIVVAGTFTNDVALARYWPDGRLDASFGSGGVVTTDLGGEESLRALRQQPDGTLVVAGSFSTGNTTDMLLARYEALGCPTADPELCLAALAAFVTESYQAALARPPDAGEEAYWVEVLATEPSPDTVRGMLHVVCDGPEFRRRPVTPWQYVGALYRAMLGRAPDQAELDWWVAAYLERVTTILPLLITSAEFQRLVPDCRDEVSVILLVGRLYQQVLRRVASAEEPAWWTDDIATWCDIPDAVEVFFNSLEYLSIPRTLADHVTVLYRALLAREPDAGERAWWVDDLAGQLAALEDALMASPEFEAYVDRLSP